MNFEKPFLFLLVFFSISTIISLWSLYFFRFSPLIFVISLAVSFLVIKKVELKLPKISTSAILLCVLVAFLAAYPYFLITPFVDASADPAAHISTLAIGNTMPETYAPFSELEYRYQIGFPLLAKMFIDLLPFVSSNFIVWGLGVLFAFISAVLIYLISKEIFKDEKYGLIGLALFIGSKIIFQNMYWGQYTFMLASVFFLACFLAFYKKSFLAFLFFPMIFIAHPGVAFYSLIFFILWVVVFKNFKEVFKLFLSGLLVLPAFFISYIHFLSNIGAEESAAFTIGSFFHNALIFPLWVGLLIFTLAIIAIIWVLVKKEFTKINIFFILVFIVSGLISVFFSATGRVMGGRIIELAMFSGLLLGVLLIKKLLGIHPKISKHVLVFLFIISIALFFTSGQLNYLRSGSKITQDEIDFAYEFKNFDPEYKKTIFLIDHSTKVAELSQKIPFDVMSGWYLSYDKRIIGDDSFYSELVKNHKLAENVRHTQCIECIRNIDFYYIVTDNDYFSSTPGLEKIFEYPPYTVFSK